MKTDPTWKDLFREIRVYAIWSIAGLIDALFLTFWIVVQWLMSNYVIDNYLLSGIDKFVLSIFQIVFAITTLTPIIIYIYSDLSIMFIRARRKVRREIERDGKD